MEQSIKKTKNSLEDLKTQPRLPEEELAIIAKCLQVISCRTIEVSFNKEIDGSDMKQIQRSIQKVLSQFEETNQIDCERLKCDIRTLGEKIDAFERKITSEELCIKPNARP